MKSEVESRYFVDAASKVLDVLESFSSRDEKLSITDVARRANLTYSSAFRLLYTLERRGYVTRAAGSKQYHIAPARRRFRIGYAALRTTRFQREVTWSILAAARASATVLMVRDNDEFNIAKALLNADRLLAEKIDLLIEYQFNETASHLIAAKCHDAGVPVMAINCVQPGAYYYGGNNYLTGLLAANFLSDFARTHWKGAAQKCVVLPVKGLGSTQEARIAGLRDGLSRGLPALLPEDVLLAPASLSVNEAAGVTLRALRSTSGKKPKRILLAPLTDPLGIGAERAVRLAGLEDQIVIVGQGGARDARRRIAVGGPFKASVAFFPDSYGDQVLSFATNVLEGDKVSLTAYTNHVVLTAENLKEHYPSESLRRETSRGQDR
jgi:ribose transport system substrate-binding protein